MDTVRNHYDFCLAWNLEHDAGFVEMLGRACISQGLSMLQVTSSNLEEVLKSLDRNMLTFQVLFDRASDSDAHFLALVYWARDQRVYCINPHDLALRASDKAIMHYAFINAGIYTPYSIILPPYRDQPILPSIDLSPLGSHFVIKPARGGGGEGVIFKATKISQALTARKENPSNSYLLQEVVEPVKLGSRRAWFRVIYCAGQVYLCWWDTVTHVYIPVTLEEETKYGLSPLRDIATAASRISGLQLFSTEIAYTSKNLFVAIDNVNDQIDLRLQSRAVDGVPDAIAHDIAHRLAVLIASHCPSEQCKDKIA